MRLKWRRARIRTYQPAEFKSRPSHPQALGQQQFQLVASSCFMLMICSSVARKRSPDSVVACCFGRIVTSDAAKESWFAARGNPKMKWQGSVPSGREILQSQIAKSPKTRLTFSRLAVVHGRRTSQAHRARQHLPRDSAPTFGRERLQAVAQEHVLHSSGRWRIRRPHGGCARRLC